MPTFDDIGKRMKDYYESRNKTYLTRGIPVILRVDGKKFSSFCERFEKPYDFTFNFVLGQVMSYLCKKVQGTKFAIRHSDEISLLLTDTDTYKTEPFFDYKVQKIDSVVASWGHLQNFVN